MGWICLLLLSFLALPALADDDELLLTADEVRYDEARGIVTARGRVEIVRDNQVLLADQVSYYRTSGNVAAEGNVSLLQADGTVLFSDYFELGEGLREGFAERVGVLFADNSRFAAAHAERVAGRYTVLRKAVYSPCDLCPTDPDAPPLWQIRSERITHDATAQDVIHRDARLEMFGVPTFYSPYLSHPDPTVFQRSGFLPPAFGTNEDIGRFWQGTYYWGISPSNDLTLTPTLSTKDGLHGYGQYRHRFADASLTLEGSLVHAMQEEADGTELRRWRGHGQLQAQWDVSRALRAGADLNYVSDDVYLERYRLPAPDILPSEIYAERFVGRNYADIRALTWQDLRPGLLPEEPVVLPLVTYQALGEPGLTWGGRWAVTGGLQSIQRERGVNSRRLMLIPGWERTLYSQTGLVTRLQGEMVSALWWSDQLRDVDNQSLLQDNVVATRITPQGQIQFSYPLARTLGPVREVIEPLAAIIAAPNSYTNSDIPNEDSRDLEFDTSNLFRLNRYPGIDQNEGGVRGVYGLRYAAYGDSGASAELFFGQSYRRRPDRRFAAGSGLAGRWSDYVALASVRPATWFDLLYATRLAADDFTPRRHDLAAYGGPRWFRPAVDYFFVDETAGTGVPQNREQIVLSLTSAFTQYWTASISQTRNLTAENGGPLSNTASLSYADECFSASLIGTRDNTVRRGLESGDSLIFRVFFKNLGGVESGRKR